MTPASTTATIIPKVAMPLAKFQVPSIGSTTTTVPSEAAAASTAGSAAAASSPSTAASGIKAARPRVIAASARVSASVTRSSWRDLVRTSPGASARKRGITSARAVSPPAPAAPLLLDRPEPHLRPSKLSSTPADRSARQAAAGDAGGDAVGEERRWRGRGRRAGRGSLRPAGGRRGRSGRGRRAAAGRGDDERTGRRSRGRRRARRPCGRRSPRRAGPGLSKPGQGSVPTRAPSRAVERAGEVAGDARAAACRPRARACRGASVPGRSGDAISIASA